VSIVVDNLKGFCLATTDAVRHDLNKEVLDALRRRLPPGEPHL
jgi:hypothetical protein